MASEKEANKSYFNGQYIEVEQLQKDINKQQRKDYFVQDLVIFQICRYCFRAPSKEITFCCYNPICQKCFNDFQNFKVCKICLTESSQPHPKEKLDITKQELSQLCMNARFFIIKSPNQDNIDTAKKFNLWATTSKTQRKLFDAYDSQKPVILLFRSNQNQQNYHSQVQHFQGCAKIQNKQSEKQQNVKWKKSDKINLGNNFDIQWLRIGQIYSEKLKDMKPSQGNTNVLFLKDGIQQQDQIQDKNPFESQQYKADNNQQNMMQNEQLKNDLNQNHQQIQNSQSPCNQNQDIGLKQSQNLNSQDTQQNSKQKHNDNISENSQDINQSIHSKKASQSRARKHKKERRNSSSNLSDHSNDSKNIIQNISQSQSHIISPLKNSRSRSKSLSKSKLSIKVTNSKSKSRIRSESSKSKIEKKKSKKSKKNKKQKQKKDNANEKEQQQQEVNRINEFQHQISENP
ncbi:hypothetical protein PPERSA_07297 [Pseudocohnilembus persalinus]|uniref:YTH domain-containing protein n=1 Tax=Pseudocohnilembus persalinus TaxID=266149 RepID=A0A0V0QGK1_PSEPJ|nr:hypothetical protein PPERSA_07297 [Pseudocohnilembus persalinus]|eukprot:KRX01258.1 hypothetical protein PPERSA_07297 [Pseudocohnilembus persalinus]